MNFWEWCLAHKLEAALIAAAVLVVLIVIIGLIVHRVHKVKKKNAKGKIFKTTDGFLGNRPDIKKPRRVIALEQRKDDGAVAVVKIYSKDGKKRQAQIKGLTLTPDGHISLTEESIVDSHVIIAVKQKDGSYRAIFPSDLTITGDELTAKEFKAVKEGVHNDTPEHRKHYQEKMKKWQKHFKE